MAGLFSSMNNNKKVKKSGSLFAQYDTKEEEPKVEKPPVKTGGSSVPKPITKNKATSYRGGDMRTNENILKANIKEASDKGIGGTINAFGQGIVDSATLGLADKLAQGKVTRDISNKNHKVATTVGEITGYLLPGMGAGKLAKPIVGKIGGKIAQKVVKGALEGGTVLGAESAIRGNDLKTVAKDTALGAGFGVAGEGLMAGASKLFKNLKPKTVTRDASKVVNERLALPEPKKNDVPLLTGEVDPQWELIKNGKLKPKEGPLQFKPKVIEGMPPQLTEVETSALKTQPKATVKKTTEPIKSSLKPKNITNKAERTALDNYYADLEYQNYINNLNPDYIRAENALRAKKGLPPLADVKTSVITKKGRNIVPNNKSSNPEYFITEGDSNGAMARIKKTPGKKVEFNNQIVSKNDFVVNPKNEPLLIPKKFTPNKQLKPTMNVSEFSTNAEEMAFKKQAELSQALLNQAKQNLKPNEPLQFKRTIEIPNTVPPKVQSQFSKETFKPLDISNFPKGPTGTTTNPNIVSMNQKSNLNPVQWLHNLYTKTVDVTHPINMLQNKGNFGSESIKTMANNTRTATGQAKAILEGKLVNKAGQEIGKGYNEILSQVPKKDIEKFDEYLLHKHNVARMNAGKPVFGFDVTAEDSARIVRELEAAHPNFKQASQDLNEFMNKFSNEWGVGSGRVSKELMAKSQAMYPDYVPVWRATDPTFVPSESNRNFVTTAGKFLKRAIGGNSEIISPTEAIRTMVEKNVKNARQNEFYNSLLDEVIKNPAEMKKRGITITETGKETLDELAKVDDMKALANFEQLKADARGGNVLTVMRNGQPVSLRIQDKNVFKALNELRDGLKLQGIEKVSRVAQAPMKSLITQSNPIFAIRNIARDIPTAIVNTRNNPLAYTKNLVTGIKDMATKADLYKEYKALSGSSANLVNDGVKILKKEGPIRKAIGATETLPRYAEFKSTMERAKKLGINDYSARMQGLFDAMDITTNFSRYGNVTKHVDSITPYLNAGVQGLDKMARTFIDKPIATILKGATVVSAPVLVVSHFNKDNPHYQQLDNRTKDTYILIPDMTNVDENGQAKTFYKIPKSREIGVLFGSLLERALRANSGEKNAWKGFGGADGTIANNFAPSNPLTSNLYAPLAINLPMNKDFAGRSIVPNTMKDRSGKYQYDETTSWFAKQLGNLTGYSPKQADYLAKSYTGIIWQMMQPATADSGDLKKVLTNQFTSNPLYSNQALSDFYDNLDNISRATADRNFVDNIPSSRTTKEERLKNNFLKGQKKMAEYSTKATKSETQDEAEKFRQKMIDLANRYNSKVK